jgi:hypothetical protein
MGLTATGNLVGMNPAAVPPTGPAPYGGKGLTVPGITQPTSSFSPVTPPVDIPVDPNAPVNTPTTEKLPSATGVATSDDTTITGPSGNQLNAAAEAGVIRAKQDVTNLVDSEKKRISNERQAKSTLPFIAKMSELVDQSTGSGTGALIDRFGNWSGVYSTEGARAIAEIAPLANKVLMSVERFEGPQSDKDVTTYREAAGKLSDPTVPPDQKQAALKSIRSILHKYAPNEDWSVAFRGKDKEAYNWAKKNKDDPRAAKILENLGL